MMRLSEERRATPGHSSQCDTANSVVLAKRSGKPPPDHTAHLADVPRLETDQNSTEETFLYLKLQNLTRPSDSSAARHCRNWARGTARALSSLHSPPESDAQERSGWLRTKLPRGRLFRRLPVAEGWPGLPEV